MTSTLVCDICNESLKSSSMQSISEHRRILHSKTFKMFICKPCQYVALMDSSLYIHFKSEKHINCMQEKQIDIEKQNKIEKFTFEKQEGVKYKTGNKDLRKLLKQIGYDFSCGNISNPTSMKSESQPHESETSMNNASEVECEICMEKFKHKSSLNKHKARNHSNKLKLFICKPCKYVTLHHATIIRHQKQGAHLECVKVKKISPKYKNEIHIYNYQNKDNIVYDTNNKGLIKLLQSINYDFSMPLEAFTDLNQITLEESANNDHFQMNQSEHNINQSVGMNHSNEEGANDDDDDEEDYDVERIDETKRLRIQFLKATSDLEKERVENEALRTRLATVEEEKTRISNERSVLEMRLTKALDRLNALDQQKHAIEEMNNTKDLEVNEMSL